MAENTFVWVDIPVVDLDRAIRFYSAVTGSPVSKESYPGMEIGIFEHTHDAVSGCLHKSDTAKPSADGPLVYLNVQDRLDEAIAAVEPMGGKVLQARHSIGPYGSRALVLDSEGNRIALHSM